MAQQSPDYKQLWLEEQRRREEEQCRRQEAERVQEEEQCRQEEEQRIWEEAERTQEEAEQALEEAKEKTCKTILLELLNAVIPTFTQVSLSKLMWHCWREATLPIQRIRFDLNIYIGRFPHVVGSHLGQPYRIRFHTRTAFYFAIYIKRV